MNFAVVPLATAKLYFEKPDEVKVPLTGIPEYVLSAISLTGDEILVESITPEIALLDKKHRFVLDIDDEIAPNQFNKLKANWYGKIEKGLNFGSKIIQSNKPFIIHCVMGFSRSTGIAYASLCGAGLRPENAYKALLKASHLNNMGRAIVPNQYIVKMADDILGLNGEMLSVEYEYIRDNQKIILDDLVTGLNESVEYEYKMYYVNQIIELHNILGKFKTR